MTDIVVSSPDVPRRLDAIDRKILTVLQQDASLSVADIGERVGLSSTHAGSASKDWKARA